MAEQQTQEDRREEQPRLPLDPADRDFAVLIGNPGAIGYGIGGGQYAWSTGEATVALTDIGDSGPGGNVEPRAQLVLYGCGYDSPGTRAVSIELTRADVVSLIAHAQVWLGLTRPERRRSR